MGREPAELRIDEQGDVWERVRDPYSGTWYELNRSQFERDIDAMKSKPITFE